jgi:hypothetical protein
VREDLVALLGEAPGEGARAGGRHTSTGRDARVCLPVSLAMPATSPTRLDPSILTTVSGLLVPVRFRELAWFLVISRIFRAPSSAAGSVDFKKGEGRFNIDHL